MRLFKIFITTAILLNYCFVFAQTNHIDSLENLFKTEKSLQRKADLLNELRKATEFTDIEAAQQYTQKLKRLGEKSQSQYIMGLALLSQGSIAELNNQLDTAEVCLSDALEIFKRLNEQELIFDTINILAILHKSKGNLIQAIRFMEEAIQRFDKKTSPKTKIKFYSNLGFYYMDANHDKALEALYKSLKLSQEYDNYLLASIHSFIGGLYQQQEKYKDAIKYFDEGIKIAVDEQDIMMQFQLQSNLQTCHEGLGNNSIGLKLAKKNLELANQMNVPIITLQANVYLANSYIENNQFELAKVAIDSVQKNINFLPIGILTSMHYGNLVNYHITKKEFSKALKYAQQSYERAKKYGTKRQLMYALNILYDTYKQMDNYKAAFKYLDEYKTINDSLVNENNIQGLTTQKLQYEFEQEQKVQAEINKAKLERQNTIKWTLLIIVIILSSLAFVVYKNYISETKNNFVIKQQKNELQALYNHKNKLFANISHELQTPLTLILSSVQSLKDKKEIHTSNSIFLNNIQNHVSSLQQVTRQVLDLAQSEQDELQLEGTEFLLKDFVTYLKIDFRSIARYRNIQYTLHSLIKDDFTLITDGYKLLTVVKNLLSNAFKFTSSGGTINLNVFQNDKNTISITVQDSGKGIKSADLSLIFNRYFQTTDKNTAVEGGMGIGLAICKEYIQLIGGNIQVKSTEGKGSIFKIEFPAHLSHLDINEKTTQTFNEYLKSITATDESIFNTSLTPKSTQKTPVLVVEDNISMCEHLNTILSPDYELTFAPHGKKALEFLKKDYSPNLIISDLMMHEMDGFTLVQELKSCQKHQDIPVLMLTARDNISDKMNAFRIGVDNYLTKPFLAEELKAHANLLINNFEERKDFLKELAQINILDTSNSSNNSDTNLVYELPEEDLQWLEKLQKVVLKNIEYTDFSVNNLADEMAVSYTHIFREVKRLTGFTPYQYIKEIRLLEAKKMLESKRYRTVKAIAYKVGQNNLKHFSVVFKKRFGQTPSYYLKS